MQRLLPRACHATNLAREQGVALKPGLIMQIEGCYDTILADGLAFQQARPAASRGRQPRQNKCSKSHKNHASSVMAAFAPAIHAFSLCCQRRHGEPGQARPGR
jgi:hypothetical protein